MNLLIVDDNATNRKLLRVLLEAENYHVLEAVDGIDALQVLEREAVDAVISDILMPNMDGFRLCLEIRRHPRFGGLAFIIYTSTYDSPSDRQLAKTIGADNYLVKPAPVTVIIEAVQEAFRKGRTRGSVSESHGDTVYVLKQYNQALVAKLEERNIELERAHDELRLTHEKLRHLLVHSPAVIYTLKLDREILEPAIVSENIERLLGYSVGESTRPDWWLESLHPEDRNRALKSIREGLNKGGFSVEYRIRHKDGSYRWLEDTNRVIGDIGGLARESVGVWTDITERHRAEEAFKERAAELERFHRLSVGRELQMIELKKEINELNLQAGRPPPYDLSLLEKSRPPRGQP